MRSRRSGSPARRVDAPERDLGIVGPTLRIGQCLVDHASVRFVSAEAGRVDAVLDLDRVRELAFGSLSDLARRTWYDVPRSTPPATVNGPPSGRAPDGIDEAKVPSPAGGGAPMTSVPSVLCARSAVADVLLAESVASGRTASTITRMVSTTRTGIA